MTATVVRIAVTAVAVNTYLEKKRMGVRGKVTYPKVVEYLTEAVDKNGQRAVARDSGVALKSIQRFLRAEGEPTTATLQKIADYFGVTVPHLRGEDTVADKTKVFESYLDERLGAEGLADKLTNRFQKILQAEILVADARNSLQETAYDARWVLYGSEIFSEFFIKLFGNKWLVLAGLAKQVIDKYETVMSQCDTKECKRLQVLRNEFEKSKYDSVPRFIKN